MRTNKRSSNPARVLAARRRGAWNERELSCWLAPGCKISRSSAKLKITPKKAARQRNRFLDGGFAALE